MREKLPNYIQPTVNKAEVLLSNSNEIASRMVYRQQLIAQLQAEQARDERLISQLQVKIGFAQRGA
jgi:hypothetical protein